MGSTITPDDLIARVVSVAMQIAGHGGNGICEQEKVELRERILERDRQISKLCKEVAFLGLGFTTLSPTGLSTAAGFNDLNINDSSGSYSRSVHRCVLASKSMPMKSEFRAIQSKPAPFYLPGIRYRLERIGGEQCESASATDIYDAFIDYFYTAFVSASDLQGMWADLLFLALHYDVADLRDECVQYVQGIDNIVSDHPKHFTAFLSLGLEFNSKPVITLALHLVKRPCSYLDSEEFKKLVRRFPHVDHLISQTERSKSLNDEAMKIPNSDAA